MNNFKKYIIVFSFVVSVLSVSAFADFTSTDSSHLNTLMGYNTYAGKSVARYLSDIYVRLDTYLPSIVQVESATKDIRDEVTGLGNSITTIRTYLSRLSGQFYDADGDTVRSMIESIDDALYSSQGNSVAYLLNNISNKLSAENKTVSMWADLTAGRTKLIYDLLNDEKEKEADALGDYSSSGGRSASNTSSDVGAISGSLSNSFNSGVSASSALNAVQDNQSDFEYFFFGMKNDLNTTGGGALRAPARGSKSVDSGSQVPDFLSDYWEGLNGK